MSLCAVPSYESTLSHKTITSVFAAFTLKNVFANKFHKQDTINYEVEKHFALTTKTYKMYLNRTCTLEIVGFLF